MIRATPLRSIPSDLQFPPGLEERIAFDPQRQVMTFRGFMSKRDFDKLVVLSNDVEYQRAIERLYQVCTYSDNDDPYASQKRWVWYLSAAVAAFSLALTMLVVIAR